MKIIHCSDLHLDSRLEANLSPERARARNDEITATFLRLTDTAREQGVRLVLIAGDLFDSARVSAKTADLVLGAVERAPETDFLYLRGNHDESARAFAGRRIPGNLRRFTNRWLYYDYGDVTVAGIEPETEADWRAMYSALSLDHRRTNIVMLHGTTGAQPGPERIDLHALRNRHIRYLALGHLHRYRKEPLDAEGEACYCGCLEGRGFDECGEKGYVLLEIEGGRFETRFVPFARRRLYDLTADITDLRTIPELLDALRLSGAGVPRESLVRFTLTGAAAPDVPVDLRFLTDRLRPEYYHVEVRDRSRLALEPESYEHDASLRGAFLRLVMASDEPEAEKERIIRCGLQALDGEEIRL